MSCMQLDDLSASYTDSLGLSFITFHFEFVLLLAFFGNLDKPPK